MTVAPGPTPLPAADTGDLAEQAAELVPDEAPPDDAPLTPDADTGDVLDQRREIGWDEEHDVTG